MSRPPSMARVLLVLAVIGLCLGLLAIETWIGWPEWMKVERTPRLPRF